ncbi:hypothetical protein TIFTF001_016415 [Ficus carica]|uniref:Uncharacterized protein n=1 Tax=Ficus carica TaxID=3494 RepID=A0AA88A693_FICCA|nr:hypothetical protein TIFTF001_016415 [Ficus carica]
MVDELRLINDDDKLLASTLDHLLRRSEPPRPMTGLRKGSTSSAQSMVRSSIGWESRSERGIP